MNVGKKTVIFQNTVSDKEKKADKGERPSQVVSCITEQNESQMRMWSWKSGLLHCEDD